jgi:uncharacterized membrane protein YraQ (UPF0718 family)
MRAEFMTIIIALFVGITIFSIFANVLPPIFDTLRDTTNTSLGTTDQKSWEARNTSSNFYNSFPVIFGRVGTVLIIGIVLAYLLNTHRKEQEEFEEFDRYR